MKRRHFVATALLTGSAAGCVGLQTNDSPTESNETTETPEGDSTETMTKDKQASVQRTIELTDVTPPSEDIPVSIGIDIQESEVTADHPARIEVGFVFTDDARFETGPELPMGKTLSDDDTPGLVLLQPWIADGIPRVDDETWKPDRPKDQRWDYRATASNIHLSAHSLLTSELVVWADHQYDGYFEPGEYRFPNRFTVDDERVSWSFTISVSDPE